MKNYIIIAFILCLTSIGYATDSRKYLHETPKLNAEFDSVYGEIKDNGDDDGFHDRGNANYYDVLTASLTTNGAWHDLDLSAIIPNNTTAVVLSVLVKDDAVGSTIQFRKNGNTAIYNRSFTVTQVADVYSVATIIVPCDEDGIIEYLATNTTWTEILITVVGWFK